MTTSSAARGTSTTKIKITGPSYFQGERASRSMKFQQGTSNIDKGLKAANFFMSTMAQICEEDNISPQAADGLRSLASDARHVRNGVGLWNAAQSIPRVIFRAYEFNAAYKTYIEKDQATWRIKKESDGSLYYEKIPSARPVTKTEKALGVTAAGLKILEWLCFNVCFIVCAPAQWLDRWFNLGSHAKNVGSQFTLFFLIKDVFLYGGVLADLGKKKYEFAREHPLTQQLKDYAVQKKLSATEKQALLKYIQAENAYREKKYEAVIVTVKSACDIALGVFSVARIKVDVWATLSLGVVSSIVGLWEIYRDTAPGEPDKKEGMPEALKLSQKGLQEKVNRLRMTKARATSGTTS